MVGRDKSGCCRATALLTAAVLWRRHARGQAAAAAERRAAAASKSRGKPARASEAKPLLDDKGPNYMSAQTYN